MVSLLKIARLLVEDACRWVLLLFRSAEALRSENLFLRRQLALYIERGVRPRRVDPATRTSLALLARLFDWRDALVVVQPATSWISKHGKSLRSYDCALQPSRGIGL